MEKDASDLAGMLTVGLSKLTIGLATISPCRQMKRVEKPCAKRIF